MSVFRKFDLSLIPSAGKRALELLGKHQGMFADNLNLGGSVGLSWEDSLKELE